MFNLSLFFTSIRPWLRFFEFILILMRFFKTPVHVFSLISFEMIFSLCCFSFDFVQLTLSLCFLLYIFFLRPGNLFIVPVEGEEPNFIIVIVPF